MKLTNLIFILILLFSCNKQESKTSNDQINKTGIINSIPQQYKPSQQQPNLKISAHYIAIGYFDDKNNLKKVERFIDGKLLQE